MKTGEYQLKYHFSINPDREVRGDQIFLNRKSLQNLTKKGKSLPAFALNHFKIYPQNNPENSTYSSTYCPYQKFIQISSQ